MISKIKHSLDVVLTICLTHNLDAPSKQLDQTLQQLLKSVKIGFPFSSQNERMIIFSHYYVFTFRHLINSITCSTADQKKKKERKPHFPQSLVFMKAKLPQRWEKNCWSLESYKSITRKRSHFKSILRSSFLNACVARLYNGI